MDRRKVMIFKHLIRKAAEEANENELITLTVTQVRDHLDDHGDATIKFMEQLDKCLDLAQGAVFIGETDVNYVIIKIIE
jgi:hypothetical protein